MINMLRNTKEALASNFETPSQTRGLDLVISGISLLLLAPFFLFIGVMIKLTSVGPIFYMVERVGQTGRRFMLYKFRCTYLEVERSESTRLRKVGFTPVGRFLRRTKLDNLPQLINVLRGEMSLVGPQPEEARHIACYTEAQCQQLLAVRPGMFGINAFYAPSDEKEFLAKDDGEIVIQSQILTHKLNAILAYLQRRTIWTDLSLIFRTSATIFSKDYLDMILELRNRHFFLFDISVLLLLPTVALLLRLERLNWGAHIDLSLVFYTLVALFVKLSLFYRLGLYNRYWRYANVNDLTLVLIASSLSTIALTMLFLGAHSILASFDLAMYRSVPLIDGLLTGLAIGGVRFCFRGLYNWRRQHQGVVGGRRVLVVGAGEAGTMVVREMRANPNLNMEPIAFVDDDPSKVDTHVQCLPVLGTTEEIPLLVDQYQIQRIIVAIPSASLARQREIISVCEQTGIATDSLPGIYELLAGSKTISLLPQIDINRLLHREPIAADQSRAATILSGSKILITGAGGSIGSELCRQIARADPALMILLGHGENSIFELGLDLHLTFPSLVTIPAIVDVRDEQRVNHVVEKYRPNIIFHAAAHKHVPFMEANVDEAITNNVLGTRNVLQAATEYGVERFVLISSDKAVNPTSIMGATKRMGELLVMAAAQQSGRAYMAVRFGNVLGSRGSVIPIFQRQIAAGGPLTITHPKMTRYFMTIPEAVHLVLEAAVMGRGKEVFVLDMGEPVKILDLATDIIKLSGLEPERDIKIVYSGIRPGEKLSEELFLADEDYQRTTHGKIFVAKHENIIETQALEQVVLELIKLTQCIQTRNATEQIQVLLPKICYYLDRYQLQSQSIPSKSAASLAATPARSLLQPQPSTSGA